jgi:hypothetical protein
MRAWRSTTGSSADATKAESVHVNLFGKPESTGPGDEPLLVPARPTTPWNRRLAVVLAIAAVTLVLNVIDGKLIEHDPESPQPTRLASLENDMAPRPEDIALTQVVARGMAQTQTDPAAWAHVTQVRVVSNIVVVQVGTSSKAVVERVCKQARRYVYSPNPYGAKLRRLMVLGYSELPIIGLDGKDDACVASRLEKP